MAYERRKRCESEIYHIIARGEGRMLIYEDSFDRVKFLELMRAHRGECSIDLLAWCLMGNHVHLILRGDLSCISKFMEKVERSYARYFNARHDHVGHLFQGRFKSVPIESDGQLLETVRYVHRNPVEGGISESCDFKWSSYSEYIGNADICDTALVLETIGGLGEFKRFHANACDSGVLPARSTRARRLSEGEALDLVSRILRDMGLEAIPTQDKALRDSVLAKMKREGTSIRQIERATGIGRNIIAAARDRKTNSPAN